MDAKKVEYIMRDARERAAAILDQLADARERAKRAIPPPPPSGVRLSRSFHGAKTEATLGRYSVRRYHCFYTVSAHWKMVAYGPNYSKRRRTWIASFTGGDRSIEPSAATKSRRSTATMTAQPRRRAA